MIFSIAPTVQNTIAQVCKGWENGKQQRIKAPTVRDN